MRRHARVAVDPEAVEVGLRPDTLTEAIFESAAVAVIATNDRGVITRWNHAAERLLGWGVSEAIGRLVNIIIPDDRRFEIAAIMSALGRGDEIRPIDTVRRAKDGSAIRVELRVSPVLDDAGHLVGVSNMLVENSEQVETRRALAASESRYRALVDALAEFVLITDLKGAVGYRAAVVVRVHRPGRAQLSRERLARSHASAGPRGARTAVGRRQRAADTVFHLGSVASRADG